MPKPMPANPDDDAAWRAIVNDIVDGIGTRYPIGEQLPTYRAMAARHQVSLTPVRTAYGRLKTAGVIEAQAGRGVWLRRPPAATDELDGPSLIQQVRQLRADHAATLAALDTLSAQVSALVEMLPGWPPAPGDPYQE